MLWCNKIWIKISWGGLVSGIGYLSPILSLGPFLNKNMHTVEIAIGKGGGESGVIGPVLIYLDRIPWILRVVG